MRYVSVNSIEEGMVIAKQLIGKNGELLLNSGAVLVKSYINKIKALGYSGVYVEDKLSTGIEISDVIDEKLRHAAVKEIKDTFISINNGKKISLKYINEIKKVVTSIIDNILANKDAMVNIIDLKVFDDYTYFHSVNVCVLSLVIGTSLNYNKDQLYKLGLAAIMHDIGKVFVPKKILNKNAALTKDEFEVVKKHSYLGYSYIKDNTEIPSMSYVGILQHHEKFNGTGYPFNLNGDKISQFGRIVSIVDVYDALTSNRSYRNAASPSEAIEFIMGNSGNSFDPVLVDIFCKKVAPYPIGTSILLSDNRIGLVIQNYEDCCTRPVVKIYKHGNKKVKPYIIDLKNDKNAMSVTIKNYA
jgi:HD-GYP domain-containing protein (c-di-GMP phosphodiesterase class II)